MCARIKEELLKNYNLHTIVRLPEGTFSPYTDIPANVLFFDRSGSTDSIWYYQIPLPEGRRKYTKTKPMQLADLTDCLVWFQAEKRSETDRAWKVDFKVHFDQAIANATPHWEAAKEAAVRVQKLEREAKQRQAELRINNKSGTDAEKLRARLDELNSAAMEERGIQSQEQVTGDLIYWPIFNLDHKNPIGADDLDHRPPAELVGSILTKEREILFLIEEVQSEVGALG